MGDLSSLEQSVYTGLRSRGMAHQEANDIAFECDINTEYAVGVYLVEIQAHGLVKIGWSGRLVSDRVRSMQSGCPYELSLIGVFDVPTMHHEQAMHRALRSNLFRGEWFVVDGLVSQVVRLVRDSVDAGHRKRDDFAVNNVGRGLL